MRLIAMKLDHNVVYPAQPFFRTPFKQIDFRAFDINFEQRDLILSRYPKQLGDSDRAYRPVRRWPNAHSPLLPPAWTL